MGGGASRPPPPHTHTRTQTRKVPRIWEEKEEGEGYLKGFILRPELEPGKRVFFLYPLSSPFFLLRGKSSAIQVKTGERRRRRSKRTVLVEAGPKVRKQAGLGRGRGREEDRI